MSLNCGRGSGRCRGFGGGRRGWSRGRCGRGGSGCRRGSGGGGSWSGGRGGGCGGRGGLRGGGRGWGWRGVVAASAGCDEGQEGDEEEGDGGGAPVEMTVHCGGSLSGVMYGDGGILADHGWRCREVWGRIIWGIGAILAHFRPFWVIGRGVLRLRQSVVHPALAGQTYNRLPALRTNGGGGPGYVGSRLRGNDEWVRAGMAGWPHVCFCSAWMAWSYVLSG